MTHMNDILPIYKNMQSIFIDHSKKEGDKILSILICSLKSREHLLNRSLYRLYPQLTDEVEVLIGIDDGSKAIGAKRNDLLSKAKGEYVAFVDDDDLVSYDYIKKVVNACKQGKDCCSLEGVITTNLGDPKRFLHEFRYRKWATSGGVYLRCPNHLNAVKRDIAIKVGFPELDMGEDKDYSDRLLKELKSEAKVSGVIYYYLFKKAKGKHDNGPKPVPQGERVRRRRRKIRR